MVSIEYVLKPSSGFESFETASLKKPFWVGSVVPSVVQSDFHHMAKDTSVDSLFEIPERTPELDGASGARTSYCQRACLHMCV